MLTAGGTADQRILFSNDRFDNGFVNAPGQWGGIVFLEGSENNIIEFADIRNAQFGVRLGTPDEDDDLDLTIGNTRIENMSNTGILAFTSDLYVYNTLVNNCAINVVGNYIGGNYRYEHCTFANYSFQFFREEPIAVFSDNIILDDNTLLSAGMNAELTNTIIWGSLQDEILLSNAGEQVFTILASNSLLRTTNEDFDINNNIINQDPRFLDPRNYDFGLDTLSVAKDNGIILGILNDLQGNNRDDLPDIGAFERIEN